MSNNINNILANSIGKVWSFVVIYLFVPIYLNILGNEALGIITFYTIVLSFASLIDFGITPAVARELAKKAHKNNTSGEINNLFYSSERLYIAILILFTSIAVVSIQFYSKPIIISDLYHPKFLNTILLKMIILAGLQILINFYNGALIGLGKHFESNVLQIFLSFIRSGIIIPILYIFGKGLDMFFYWQLGVTMIFVVIFKIFTNRFVAIKFNFVKPKLNFKQLLIVKKFAFGMFLITLVAALSLQIDKIFLSQFVNIKELGYYSLASTIGQGIIVIISPLTTSYLPKFTELVSDAKFEILELKFHFLLKLTSVIAFSVCLVILFNSESIVGFWLNNNPATKKVLEYLPFCLGGATLLAIMSIPFTVFIANGYTKLNNLTGIISLIFMIPAYYLGLKYYGTISIAMFWFAIQLFTIPFFLNEMNRRYVKTMSFSKWVYSDIIRPFSISIIFVFFSSKIVELTKSNLKQNLFFICFIFVFTFLITFIYTFKITSFDDFKTSVFNELQS